MKIDKHTVRASEILNKPVNKITKAERMIGQASNFRDEWEAQPNIVLTKIYNLKYSKE